MTGSPFIGLLAALNDAQAPAPEDAFAQQLSRWFDWTAAISLSAALNGAAVRTPQARPGAPSPATADEREFHRVRTALAKAIAQGPGATPTPAPRLRPASAARVPPADDGDFLTYRFHYVTAQQAMDAKIAPLRRRVRNTLADMSPAMARLAELDAVMEQVVGAQERALLATVPRWLEPHFERLRRAHAGTASPDESRAANPSGEWLDRFRRDMQNLLLAELDFRLQPVEGLLDALRQSSPDCHD